MLPNIHGQMQRRIMAIMTEINNGKDNNKIWRFMMLEMSQLSNQPTNQPIKQFSNQPITWLHQHHTAE